MKKWLSLSIAILFSTFFSTHLFAAKPPVNCDEQKEGSCSAQSTNQVQQTLVHNYTILHNNNVKNTLDDTEELEYDLEDNVSAVSARLVTTNNQTTPLILGVVLQHEKNDTYDQYLIADTGLLSKTTQPQAVKRAHTKGFHLIQATPGHVGVQLLEWLQISGHYTVKALHTNRPVCHNCYLIAYGLWQKELQNSEKGCFGIPFPLLDEIPSLAQQYINTHLNLSLVQSLVVPIMGYVGKEKMNKAIQQKDEQITMLNNEVKTKISILQLLNKQMQMFNKELNRKERQLNSKNNEISSLINKLKQNDQKIKELQYVLQQLPKKPLDKNTKQKLFEAIKKNKLKTVKELLYTHKGVVSARDENQVTAFLCTAQFGRLQIAKLLRRRGADINAKDKDENNALHLACLFSGNVSMPRWLLQMCKIPIEIKGKYQRTPFLCAAEKGQLKLAKLLRQQGANINAKDKDGNNALHLACAFSESVPMITWLLDVCKIPIETKGFYQTTPFLCAVEKGVLKLAKLLKQRGANTNAKDKDGDNALHSTCLTSGSVPMTKWLLDECKIGIEIKGCSQQTPFLCAAVEGHLEIAKLLRQKGADINAKDKDGNNALHLACAFSGSVPTATWLLEICKIGLETKGFAQKTPFLCAARNSQLEIAKLLKERGANINAKNEYGDNALHVACLFSGSVSMTTWLLDVCKIGIEAKNDIQRTPFLCAAENGQLELAKLLRTRDANINATDGGRNNALHVACFSGSVPTTTWLLEICKIGLETKGQYQRTPFLCATKKGHLEIAKLLKERGADINAKDEFGNNALHFACLFSNSVPMTAWLLDVCHIGLETKAYGQKTPFLCAVRNDHLEIAKLLKERGADINAKDKDEKTALDLAKKCNSSNKEMISYLQSLESEIKNS